MKVVLFFIRRESFYVRVSKVPVDMSSEQKEIMGVISKRQLIYLVVGGILLYSYVPLVYVLFANLSWFIGAVAAIVSALPVLFIVIFLGFIKAGKYDMNRDFYYMILLQRKTQYGNWRKGRKE